MARRGRLSLVLLLLLVTRVLLGFGPDGTVLCVHEDGGAFVESTSALCCARSGCESGRSVSATEAPGSPDDDCQDYALSTGDALIGPDGTPALDLSPTLAVAWVETLAPELPLLAREPAFAPLLDAHLLDPSPPRATLLRC